jgi:hypothetical protein
LAVLVEPIGGERDAKAFQGAHATDCYVKQVKFLKDILQERGYVPVIIAGE